LFALSVIGYHRDSTDDAADRDSGQRDTVSVTRIGIATNAVHSLGSGPFRLVGEVRVHQQFLLINEFSLRIDHFTQRVVIP
jgi:hypothetical protein